MPKRNTLLVFFNQYKQLCIYNRQTNVITQTYILLKQSGEKQYVSMRIVNNQVELQCSVNPPDPTTFYSVVYRFSDNAGSIWFDSSGEPSIVVGLGDIRDTFTSAVTESWRVPNADDPESSELIFECSKVFEIKLHFRNIQRITQNVSSATIAC